GFLIPIAILIILSIPPLFGAEIIHLLCGFTYGLGPGFLVVCAGTAIGESITFYAFRTILRSRAQKLERGEGAPRWAALARVIREGGFWAALVVRFSAIPTHMATALFSVCGIRFWTFLATLVLSLPRQLAGVYLGGMCWPSYSYIPMY
ncbi:snare associated Golgi protein, partial [Ceratobasidium sp. AG-I]